MLFSNTRVFNFEGALRGMRNPLNSWAKSDSTYGIGDLDDIAGHIDDVMFLYNQEVPFQNDEEEELLNSNLWKNARNYNDNDCSEYAIIGPKDMNLAKRLIAGGSEHRKFLRQIFVSVDITAPLYWWKEFDTYKVGTTANSTSTMHKLANTPITKECFEMGDYCRDLPIGLYAMAADEEYIEEPDYSQPIKCGEVTIYDTDTNETSTDIHYSIKSREDLILNEYFNGVIHLCERLRRLYLETKDKRYWKELIRILPNGWLQTRTVTMNYENLRSMAHQRKGHKLTEWATFCEWVETLPYAKEFIID